MTSSHWKPAKVLKKRATKKAKSRAVEASGDTGVIETKAEVHPNPRDTVLKSNIDDLEGWMGKLTIELAHLTDRPCFTQSPHDQCFMCDGIGHLIKDCAEKKAFLAAGVLRYDPSNHLIMADGPHLLHAPNGGGMTHLIRE